MFRVKSPQDFGAAVVFVTIGVAGIYLGKDLSFGSAARMGPGYFPIILSYLIVAIGLIIGGVSLTIEGPRIEATKLRPIFFILAAILAFGYFVDKIGLALVSVLLTLLAAYARPDPKLMETLLLGAGLAIFSVLVFVYALGQSLPAWWGR